MTLQQDHCSYAIFAMSYALMILNDEDPGLIEIPFGHYLRVKLVDFLFEIKSFIEQYGF